MKFPFYCAILCFIPCYVRSLSFKFKLRNRKCDLMNKTDWNISKMHAREIAEDCIFYKINSKSVANTGLATALSKIPPSNYPAGNDKVTIFVHKIKIINFAGQDWRSTELKGVVSLSWMDDRFVWNPWEYRDVAKFSVENAGTVWTPEAMGSVFFGSSLVSETEEYSFTKMKISSNGNVTADLEFSAKNECPFDERDFPFEKTSCCYDIGSENLNSIREYQIENYKSKLPGSHVTMRKYRWSLLAVDLTINREGAPLKICFESERFSPILKLEICLPLIVCIVLFLASPFVGSMKNQIMARMFTLFVQIFTFQFGLQKFALGAGSQVPKIFRCYEITVAFTVSSLIVTLFANALNKKRSSLPPPHILQFFAEKCDQFFCCGGRRSDNGPTISTKNASQSSADPTATQTEKSYAREWGAVFEATNNFLTALLMFLYVFIFLILLL
uniref:Neurotransmitter-gated ion-channel ligand-binding domain-containing protein n=1 Tax=Romanomermis culicivorax TaxID=13658 RepID=A0A915J3C5_ROMCU